MFVNDLISRSSIKFDSEQMDSSKENGKSPYIRVPRSEVKFHSDQLDKTVIVDEKGFYQADLPVGFYKMTVNGPAIGQQSLMPYARAFRVTAPTTIIINTTLQFARLTCDAVFWGDTPEEQAESFKDTCGGDDVVAMPSQNGIPLELFIRYPQRHIERYGMRYVGSENAPVFVAYGLHTLQANEVSYFAKHHELSASGNVVVEDGSGKAERLTGLHWILQDGVAARFRDELPRPLQYDQAVSGTASPR